MMLTTTLLVSRAPLPPAAAALLLLPRPVLLLRGIMLLVIWLLLLLPVFARRLGACLDGVAAPAAFLTACKIQHSTAPGHSLRQGHDTPKVEGKKLCHPTKDHT
jgi:hypothetical protein